MSFYNSFTNHIKDFVSRHFSLLSFISILLGGIFYYAASVLESQNKYVLQLEKSIKVYVDLLDNQGVILQKQQQVINDLQRAVSASIDPYTFKWYALGGSFIFLVGVGIYIYSNSNNSNLGPSSTPDSEITFRNSLQSVIDAAREEFSTISDVTKRHIQELSDVSQNLTFEAVAESKNSGYINNIVNIDDVKIANIASEKITASLVPEIDKILVSYQECTMAALGEFAKGLTERTAETILQTDGNIKRVLSKCDGTNLQMRELSNSFKSVDFNLKNSERINDEAVANIMTIRSGIQELGSKNPSLVGDIQGLSELCTYLLNLLG